MISNEPWGPTWYSKQHYANNLANEGFNIYFLNPVKNWKPRHFVKRYWKVEQITSNLHVVSYSNRYPVLPIFTKLLVFLNDRVIEKDIKRKLGLSTVLLWSFDPFRCAFNFKKSKKIYHVVDPYFTFPLDQVIARRADLLVLVSRKYQAYYQKLNPKILHIPHGIPAKSINEVGISVKMDLPNKFAILVGNLGSDLNLELLHALSDFSYPILVIGGKKDLLPEKERILDHILSKKNVFYLGVKHPDQLPAYIEKASVGLVCYAYEKDLKISSRSPLKILNYISSKIPVVSSSHPDIDELIGEGVYHAPEQNQFLDLYQKAISGNLQINNDLYERFIESHSYKKMINKILTKLDEF